jgi:small-conductance mechanosensitive channel
MDLAMWQRLWDWLSTGGYHPILWSAVTVLVAAAVYLFVRKLLRLRSTGPGASRSKARLLDLGIVLLALLVIVQIWATWALGSGQEPPVTGARTLIENILWTCAAGAIAYILGRGAQRALISRSVQIEARHKIRLTTVWIGVLVFLIAATFIWARQVQNLGVFLGIVGVGLALSMQETLLCIAGWLLVVVRRPFDIGDRIEIDGRVGDVIDIGVFQTSLLEVGNWVKADQSTGRMSIIPNSMVLRHALHNYSKGFPFVWNEFATVVTFESNWELAKTLMLDEAETEAEKIGDEVKRQIERMQTRYAIHYDQLGPIVYTSIADHGVELTLRYLTPVRMRRTIKHRISESILRAFIKHPSIDFAYPTTRIYRNTEEGKPDIGGPPPGTSLEPPPRAVG